MITKEALPFGLTKGLLLNAGLFGAMEVPGVVSGEKTVGQAMGSALTGMAGFSLADKAMGKLLPNVVGASRGKNFARALGRFGGAMMLSEPISNVMNGVLGRFVPAFRQTPHQPIGIPGYPSMGAHMPMPMPMPMY